MIGLHDGEEVILEKRRFWLPIAAQGAVLFLLGILPFFAILGANILPQEVATIASDYAGVFLFLAVAWLLMLWVVFAIMWTNYYLDVLLVTTARVVDIQQLHLFSRELIELRTENIQDIKIEVKGIVPSLLNYGNLHIQTAGERKEFIVRNIHDPHGVKEIIARQHHVLAGGAAVTPP